mgnify:FL=1
MKAKKFTEKDLRFADKSLDALRDFLKFSLRKPQILDEIPNNSYVALLPKTDATFSKINEKAAFKLAKKARTKIITFIGEKVKKVAIDNLVFLKGIISNNKEKLSNWHN